MTGLMPPGSRDRDSSRWVSILGVVLLIIAISAAALIAWREWTTFANDYTHVDEIFFAVCAARGSAVGNFPPSGCHDNKAPLIYLVYQAVEALSGRYSLAGIKLLGQTLVALLLTVVAAASFRFGGKSAALFTAVLATQVFGIHHELLALKTEIIGTIFLLVGAWVLFRWQVKRQSSLMFVAGLLYGVALMFKQTFAFGVLMVWLWLALVADVGAHRSLIVRLGNGVVFGLGVGVPLVLLAVAFRSRGQGLDFLGSVLLHALAYGVASEPAAISSRIWRFVWFVHFVGLGLPLVLAFGAAVAKWMQARGALNERALLQWREMGLFHLLAFGSMLAPLLAKQSFQSHLLPVWLLMSVPAGTSLARWLNSLTSQGSSSFRLSVCTVGLMAGTWMAGNSLHSNGDPIRRESGKHHVLDTASRVAGARGSYGYVLGVRPEFYFFNGIVPSSDVLYPGALPGSGATPPARPMQQTSAWREQAWSALQAHAEQRLREDFERTPPRFVFLVDEHSRKPGSSSVSDVAVVREYVNSRCTELRAIEGKPYQTGRLYECVVPPAGRRLSVGPSVQYRIN